MLKKLLTILLCLLMIVGVSQAAAEKVNIWVATDIHYLSPSLTDYGEVFTEQAIAGGSKLVEYSGELLDSFLEKAKEGGADVVVLTGDLTFDGEMQSLLDIIEKVKKCREEGLTVLMLPGNHDIGTGSSCDYFDATGSHLVPGISQKEFLELCSEFGRNEAVTADTNSFSFVYPLTDDVWLMLLDCNTDIAHNGRFVHRTFGWMQTAFDMAKEQGAQVLCFSHQNLLPIEAMSYIGFNVENWPELLNLLRDNDIKYNFAGHSHMQHTATWKTGLTEYATAALCIYPLQYAVITVEGDDLVYTTHSLDIYQEEAKERLSGRMKDVYQLQLEALGLPEDECQLMAEYAIDLNAAAIAGDREEINRLSTSDAWKLWQEKGQRVFWYAILNSIIEGDSY